jgi:hypothetical protein
MKGDIFTFHRLDLECSACSSYCTSSRCPQHLENASIQGARNEEKVFEQIGIGEVKHSAKNLGMLKSDFHFSVCTVGGCVCNTFKVEESSLVWQKNKSRSEWSIPEKKPA